MLGEYRSSGKKHDKLLPRAVHPKQKLTCPLKRDYFNRKSSFQPLILRGHSFVFRKISNPTRKNLPRPWHHHSWPAVGNTQSNHQHDYNSLILPTYPGKIPQTSPFTPTKKEIPLQTVGETSGGPSSRGMWVKS